MDMTVLRRGLLTTLNSATYHPYTDFHIRPAMMLAGYTP